MIKEFKYPAMKSSPKVRMRDLSIKNSKKKNNLKKKLFHMDILFWEKKLKALKKSFVHLTIQNIV